jgi:hypothetical protein
MILINLDASAFICVQKHKIFFRMPKLFYSSFHVFASQFIDLTPNPFPTREGEKIKASPKNKSYSFPLSL